MDGIYSVGQASRAWAWYICRVYTVVYPLFKTAIHDRPLADRNNICKVGRDHCFPATRFYPPDARASVNVNFHFLTSPTFSPSRLVARVSTNRFFPHPTTVFQRARGSRTRCFVRGTDLVWEERERKKGTGSEFLNYTTRRDISFRETRFFIFFFKRWFNALRRIFG